MDCSWASHSGMLLLCDFYRPSADEIFRHRKPAVDENGKQVSPRKPLPKENDGTFGTFF